MSTPEQIAANRENSKKSTGPRTTDGKARSSRNATTHGLRAENPGVVGLESQEAWETHRDVYVADLHPEGSVETQLAEKIASLNWRIGRAEAFLRDVSSWGLQRKVGKLLDLPTTPRSESHQDMDIPSRIRWLADGPHANEPLVQEILALVQLNAFPAAKLLDLIIRYSGSLERALNQAERRLDKLQDRRLAREDRAERKTDRDLAGSGVEVPRADSTRLLEPEQIDPVDPEKGSAFHQEMDRLERQESIVPPATPERPRDLGSFGCETVKPAPVATSVATAPVAKAAPMPPHPSQVVFRDSKGRVKPEARYNRFERRTREKAQLAWEQALKASQSSVAEVKIDSTSASIPIGPPPVTA